MVLGMSVSMKLRYGILMMFFCLVVLGQVVNGNFAIADVAHISGRQWAFCSALVMVVFTLANVGLCILLHLRSSRSCVSVGVQQTDNT